LISKPFGLFEVAQHLNADVENRKIFKLKGFVCGFKLRKQRIKRILLSI
jgi:hypothetical protein